MGIDTHCMVDGRFANAYNTLSQISIVFVQAYASLGFQNGQIRGL